VVSWSVHVGDLVSRRCSLDCTDLSRRPRGGGRWAFGFSHWVLDFVSHPIPFSSFSGRSWQWSHGLRPPTPIFHFCSLARRRWAWACTTQSARLRRRHWSLGCSFWEVQFTQRMSPRKREPEVHTLLESQVCKKKQRHSQARSGSTIIRNRLKQRRLVTQITDISSLFHKHEAEGDWISQLS